MADKDTTKKSKQAKTTDDEAEEVSTDEAAEEEDVVFVEEPTFDIDYKGDCAYEVKVVVPVANTEKQTEEMIDELKDEAEMPGFRRGRAPRKLVERKFAKVVRGEVESRLVGAAFRKLIKDRELRPIAMPDIEGLEKDEAREPGEPLSFTLKFEVAPRVELGKYRGVKVERPVVKVDDRDVQETIDDIRSRYAVYESLEKGAAADGDQVIIDFSGLIDGEEFAGGSAQSYPYILGTKRFFPEFEDVLLGASPGDELTCDVTFPDDYFEEKLRGKEAAFTITVNEVKRRDVPELDDKFAKQAGYEGVDDMREKVAAQLRQSSETQSSRVAENRVLDAVIEKSTFEIPASLLERSSEEYHQDEVRRLLSARVPMGQIREREDDIRNAAQGRAIRDIKRVVVLNEIASVEGIEVSDEDFEQEMESAAERMGIDIDVLGSFLQEDEERRSSYEDRIYRAKAMKLVMEHSKITDKELTRDEMDQEDEGKDD